MNGLLTGLVIWVIPTIIAITLHEASHGYAALALGDDTARRAGRLSLNPAAHFDRVGSFLLPGFLILGQLLTIGRVAFVFGWAKPVPVDWRAFRDPRRGMMLVAAAGPLMNFFLAWIGAMLIRVLPLLPEGAQDLGQLFVLRFILANLILGLFNLLPIPPLDGGRIVVGLLPQRAAMAWARLERAGILIVLLFVFILPPLLRAQGIAFDPFGAGLLSAVNWAFGAALALAGHPERALEQSGGNPFV
jgi:Zn-dependent protease